MAIRFLYSSVFVVSLFILTVSTGFAEEQNNKVNVAATAQKALEAAASNQKHENLRKWLQDIKPAAGSSSQGQQESKTTTKYWEQSVVRRLRKKTSE